MHLGLISLVSSLACFALKEGAKYTLKRNSPLFLTQGQKHVQGAFEV
jgi:hypothetical protein